MEAKSLLRRRILRIAWSVICGFRSVLLIMLWLRSYKWDDELYAPVTQNYALAAGSIMGQLIVKVRDTSIEPGTKRTSVRTQPADSIWPEMVGMFPKFAIRKERTDWAIYTPHWLPVVVLSGLFSIVWIRRRFSLRTLLIAITVAAVTLGIIAVSN
jgi:hypothetical protein